MREIDVGLVSQVMEELSIEANCCLPEDVLFCLKEAEKKEQSLIGRDVLQQIITNATIANEEMVPICQDTGLAVVFLELGQEVHFVGGYLYDAINEGIRKGYQKGYLRKSVVEHPLTRENTGDNTPAIIHTEIVPGDQLKIILVPKGAGSENMSRLSMLKPAQGKKGILDFVKQVVEDAGANSCPPLVIGIGLGGNMEQAGFLAKKALIRPLGQSSSDPKLKLLEKEILDLINCSGIGPQGLGGTVTVLAVNIEYYPTHIASLPLAVNLSCHVTRHSSRII